MPTPKIYGYTIVQHSGYGYGHKPEFSRGLETRVLNSKVKLQTVKRANGLVFPTSTEAFDYANTEPYPDSYTGFIPKAPGTFSTQVVDGLHIYIPKT